MKAILLSCVALFLAACAGSSGPPSREVGWRAPGLMAPDQEGNQLSVKARTSGPWAVVFFYPKADTPG
ncbi:MAG: hypothetical protein ACSHYF_03175 [Verrucomicrobiaceae bacterium]